MNWIDRYRQSAVARNTGWMMLGQGLRLLVQAAYFVLIARTLGAEQYGAFVAAASVTAIVAPFVGVGSANLIVKNVSRDRSLLPDYWGNGLFMTVSSALAAIVLIVAAGRLLLPASISMQVIVLVAIADLLFSRFVDLAALTFQAVERLGRTAQLNIVISLCRLVGIATVALLRPHCEAVTWSKAYLVASAAAAVFAVASVTRELARPRLALWRIRGELREGLYFAGGLSAQTIYNDIDKSMLARLATLEAAGIYAAAYRLIDVAFLPVRSLLYATYAGFFRAGSKGIAGTLAYLKRLLSRTVTYSVLAAAALMLAAPLVPYVLGPDFAHTAEALRWLALLPLLKTAHYFVSDALTGAGYQGLRMLAQVVVAIVNVLLNLWLIPGYGWRGAAWASLATDGLLAIGVACIALVLRRRRTPTVEAELSLA